MFDGIAADFDPRKPSKMSKLIFLFFYLAFGCAVHWFAWGSDFYGFASIAFIAFWPIAFVLLFAYVALAIIVAVLVLGGLIFAVVTFMTTYERMFDKPKKSNPLTNSKNKLN